MKIVQKYDYILHFIKISYLSGLQRCAHTDRPDRQTDRFVLWKTCLLRRLNWIVDDFANRFFSVHHTTLSTYLGGSKISPIITESKAGNYCKIWMERLILFYNGNCIRFIYHTLDCIINKKWNQRVVNRSGGKHCSAKQIDLIDK